MHRTLLLAVVVAFALAAVGCGGGGGGGGTPVTPPPTTNSIAGTWSVPSLGLPQNQMMITSGGQVYVNGENPTMGATATRALGYYTLIGTCTSSGTLDLDGSWTYGGVYHRLTGTGTVNASAHTVSVTVTLIQDSRTVLQSAAIAGILADDTPPPVPDFSNGGDEPIDPPPAVPL